MRMGGPVEQTEHTQRSDSAGGRVLQSGGGTQEGGAGGQMCGAQSLRQTETDGADRRCWGGDCSVVETELGWMWVWMFTSLGHGLHSRWRADAHLSRAIKRHLHFGGLPSNQPGLD